MYAGIAGVEIVHCLVIVGEDFVQRNLTVRSLVKSFIAAGQSGDKETSEDISNFFHILCH